MFTGAYPESAERTARHYYPPHLLQLLERAGTRVHTLRKGQRYIQASGALSRLNLNVDGWPAPPAGLFVVEERTLYLRSQSTMTVCHELGHALDCALGEGVYRSSTDAVLRRLFETAPAFVTPYAATGPDEWFAENCRAMVEANDPAAFWPAATRERLHHRDPAGYAYFAELFERLPL